MGCNCKLLTTCLSLQLAAREVEINDSELFYALVYHFQWTSRRLCTAVTELNSLTALTFSLLPLGQYIIKEPTVHWKMSVHLLSGHAAAQITPERGQKQFSHPSSNAEFRLRKTSIAATKEWGLIQLCQDAGQEGKASSCTKRGLDQILGNKSSEEGL